MQWSEKELAEAMDTIEEKAATDKEFRALCLSNPQEAIKVATGKEVPSSYKIRFVENEAGVQETFVLPDFKGGQLSETDLDSVAGGLGDKSF